MVERLTQMQYCIGMANADMDFRTRIVEEACLVAGGCTAVHANGYWVVGAEVEQAIYHGHTQSEFCLILNVLVPNNKAEQTRQHMKYAIIDAARDLLVDIDWVHVTSQWVMTHHFSIADDDRRT